MYLISRKFAENIVAYAENNCYYLPNKCGDYMYIHELNGWPNLTWSHDKLTDLLAEVRHLQGRLLGRMYGLGFDLRNDATLATLTQDVIKTSEIEGEKLAHDQVRSSIARRLGVNIGGYLQPDRNVEGIVEVMIDATQKYNRTLTKDRIFAWHAALFPTGRSGMERITVGNWRGESSGVMQILSGPYGREKIHFEAPNYDRLDLEMDRFLKWYDEKTGVDLVIKSAIAHFWFVTIHPFDDGNGRIARAIADMMLSRSEESGQRFYSMSSHIQKERNAYYDILEKCQKGSLNITPWIEWFLNCLKHAIQISYDTLDSILTKANFWERHAGESFNERQCLLLGRLLDGFTGKLNTSKWAKIAKCSQDTAHRDIENLIERNILIKDSGGGRNTSYSIKNG